MNPLRNLILGSALGLAAGLVVLLISSLGVFERIEGFTYDMRVRAMAPRVEAPIKIIAIDQRSLDKGNEVEWSWPWNRELYSHVIAFCKRGGVKSLSFDMYFTDPGQDVPGDRAFAEAFKSMPNIVGTLVPQGEAGSHYVWPHDVPKPPFKLAGFDAWAAAHPDALVHSPAATFPYDDLRRATKYFGHVRGQIEGDTVVRRIYPFVEFDGQAVPRLSIAQWLIGEATKADGSLGEVPAMMVEPGALRIGERMLPLDGEGASLIHYYQPRQGSPFVFEVIPIATILNSEFSIQNGEKPEIDPAIFKDCHVIVGSTAPGLGDLKATPLSPKTPGVELQAITLANLLHGHTMSHAGGMITALFTLAWSAIVCGVTARGGRWWWLAILAAAALAVPIIVGAAAYPAGVWWPVVTPLIAASFAFVAGIAYIYAVENRQRRFIRAAFAQYLSDEVIERLVNDPSHLKLGGEDRELTIFFSDIEAFSTICEHLSPTSVTALLNDVLTEITGIIHDEGGTLDKYVGDAVVAFWNAPTEQADHAVRAIRAAIRIQRMLAEREEHFRVMAGGHPLRVRIGVNTGHVLVGNLGSNTRFDYSVLGDAANLASRLEGANKAFGTHILCSLDTWSRTQGRFHGRVLGRVMVVGRATPVQIVEPLCFIEEPMPDKALLVAQAIAMCGEGQAHQAIAQLEQLADDPVAAAFVKYLKTLKPEQTLDGVWRLTSK